MKDKQIAHQLTIAYLPVWIRLLCRHKISWAKVPKVIFITLITLLLAPFHLINWFIIFSKSKKDKGRPDPIFIVGHWRSGTTFLHYLLCKDDSFGYLTYYQAFMPTLIFVGGRLLKSILSAGMPTKRPQDDVRLATNLPTEEENPLAAISVYSASLSFYFPRSEYYYRKYVLFEGTNDSKKGQWKKAYRSMVMQIGIRFPGKQLIIKNPHNTGRIKELLELFPNAKFIYLYRNPYDVFPSTQLMYDKVISTQYLQKYSGAETSQKIMYYYQTILRRYLDSKKLIQPKNLIEISYRNLLDDPMGIINKTYKQFDLILENQTYAKMSEYIRAQKNYRRNIHQLEPELRKRINEDLDFVFEEYHFSKLEPSLTENE